MAIALSPGRRSAASLLLATLAAFAVAGAPVSLCDQASAARKVAKAEASCCHEDDRCPLPAKPAAPAVPEAACDMACHPPAILGVGAPLPALAPLLAGLREPEPRPLAAIPFEIDHVPLG